MKDWVSKNNIIFSLDALISTALQPNPKDRQNRMSVNPLDSIPIAQAV